MQDDSLFALGFELRVVFFQILLPNCLHKLVQLADLLVYTEC